ncbi:hypothetical protein B0J12DRAFT_739495 [Macrophomina phaseolina]|uniref:Uncharacterized protein n=1 Tax=Macrophomina phaseolina TaxID=35725 RepID=A0ABQ8GHA3_9PEZI|nr:hypothetical protein B0J12DRAFT_739495 [Macrophomina phaseolina]
MAAHNISTNQPPAPDYYQELTDLSNSLSSPTYITPGIGTRNTPIHGPARVTSPMPQPQHDPATDADDVTNSHSPSGMADDYDAPLRPSHPAAPLQAALDNAITALQLGGKSPAYLQPALVAVADLFNDDARLAATPVAALKLLVESDLRVRRAELLRVLRLMARFVDAAAKGLLPPGVSPEELAKKRARLEACRASFALRGERLRAVVARREAQAWRERTEAAADRATKERAELAERRGNGEHKMSEEERLRKRGGKAAPLSDAGERMDVDG